MYSDEFTVYGFSASCSLNVDTPSDYDVFLDEIIDFVESRDLFIGGGGSNNEFGCFVIAGGRYDSATEDDRQAMEKWLTDSGKCTDIEISALVDANV